MVLLATVATVIASQAVITGAFSVTQQAIQLGLLPRMEIQYTSDIQAGQIFLPDTNRLLLIGVLILVFSFRTSSALASAYGIAVTGTMVVTTCLAFIVVWKAWRWPLVLSMLFIMPFLLVDGMFFVANLMKVYDGGYVPLLIAAAIMVAMWTWVRGIRLIFHKTHTGLPLVDLIHQLERSPPTRVPNTAIFLSSDPDVVPTAMLHNLKHNMVLHEQNIVMNVRTATIPRVDDADRVKIERLSEDFSRVMLDLRLHGDTQHPQGPGAGPPPGLEVRHHEDLVLRRPALDQAGRQVRHAALAGQSVPLPCPPCHQRQRLLQHPGRARGRARHGGHDLSPIGSPRAA